MREKKCGIYCIENTVTGQKYIGKSVDIGFRWNGHRTKFKNKKHANPYFQHSYDKYGEENFKYSIIELCEKEKLSEREIFYIQEFNTKHPNGYNVTDGGEGAAGLKRGLRTPEHCRKISEANKGRRHNLSDEDREKMRQRMLGNKLAEGWVPSQEYKDTQKKNLTGKKYKETGNKKRTPEQIESSRERAKGNQYAKGYKFTSEQIAKKLETQRVNRELRKAEKLAKEGPPPPKIKKRKGPVGRKLTQEQIATRTASRKKNDAARKAEKQGGYIQKKIEGIE
jgi:group I intron endonuclease